MVLAAPLPSKNSLVVKKGHKKLKKTKRAFLCLDNGWTENSITPRGSLAVVINYSPKSGCCLSASTFLKLFAQIEKIKSQRDSTFKDDSLSS